MKEISMSVQKEFCGECSLALSHFMKKIDGIESIEPQEGNVVIRFDEKKIDEGRVSKIARESIETMGYKLNE